MAGWDWADEKARSWLEEHYGAEAVGPTNVRRIAALLREVADRPDIGLRAALRDAERALLAEFVPLTDRPDERGTAESLAAAVELACEHHGWHHREWTALARALVELHTPGIVGVPLDVRLDWLRKVVASAERAVRDPGPESLAALKGALGG